MTTINDPTNLLTDQELLDLPISNSDIGPTTVREYLKELLLTLWDEESGFSGKRPFGNSGWQFDVYRAFGEAGLVEMTIDRDPDDPDDVGYIDELDDAAAEKLIIRCIKAL